MKLIVIIRIIVVVIINITIIGLIVMINSYYRKNSDDK
jgi:hypothetical protein